MIKVNELVPGIYYDESRDFQILGRSFKAVFNYLKTNVDLVNENPLNRRSSYQLIQLITKTLGFESKHTYDMEDLRVLASVFTECLRHKGSKESVDMAIKALLHAQHISKNFLCEPDKIDKCKLKIILPYEVVDTILLEDVFSYILPVGMTYDVIFGNVNPDNTYTTKIGITDSVNWKMFENNTVAEVSRFDATKSTYDNINGMGSLDQTFTGLVAGYPDSEEQEGD